MAEWAAATLGIQRLRARVDLREPFWWLRPLGPKKAAVMSHGATRGQPRECEAALRPCQTPPAPFQVPRLCGVEVAWGPRELQLQWSGARVSRETWSSYCPGAASLWENWTLQGTW